MKTIEVMKMSLPLLMAPLAYGDTLSDTTALAAKAGVDFVTFSTGNSYGCNAYPRSADAPSLSCRAYRRAACRPLSDKKRSQSARDLGYSSKPICAQVQKEMRLVRKSERQFY